MHRTSYHQDKLLDYTVMMTDSEKAQLVKIVVSAGEVSGDSHAARFITALKAQYPDSQFEVTGMGGKALSSIGTNLIIDIDKHGGINGFNLFKILSSGLYSYYKMARHLWQHRPAYLILVDYPDFNLRLARLAKFFGIKTIYLIPPKIWAWRQHRVRQIKKYIDQTIVVFPFEAEFYRQHGYGRVIYAGHPFASELVTASASELAEFCSREQIDPNKVNLAVFAGSRKSELKHHLSNLIPALKILRSEDSGLGDQLRVQFAVAENFSLAGFKAFLIPADRQWLEQQEHWISFIKGDSRLVLQSADYGLLKCGTCNLEAAYFDLPFVCFYQSTKATKWVINRFVKLKSFSLVNILRPGTVTELIQDEFKPEAVARELRALTNSSKAQQEGFADIRIALKPQEGTTDAYQSAAARIDFSASGNAPGKGYLRRLLSSLNVYRRMFVTALVAMVIFGATDGALPLIIKEFLDGVFDSKSKSSLYTLPIILLSIALIRAASGFVQEYLMAKVGLNIVKDFRNQLHAKLLALSSDFYANNSAGNLLARFTSDVILVKDFLTKSTAAVIRDSIRVVALVITSIYLDAALAFIAFIVLPVAVIPIYAFGKRIRKLSKRGQNEIGQISSLIQETIAGSRVIRLFNQQSNEQAKFTETNERLTKTFIKSEKVGAYSNPVNEILAVIGVCAVIVFGGQSVISGVRTQGEFIAFLVSIFLLYDPIKKLSKVYHQMQQGLSGAERVFEILDQKELIEDPKQPLPMPAQLDLEFKALSYHYPQSEQLVLKNINLKIKHNQKIALVGFSGSGKSTLVDFIPRFIDPVAGSVLLGGRDLRQLKLHDLRQQIAMVNQKTFLFNNTIAANIAYGIPDASDKQIRGAARAAYAEDFIDSLPAGFQTIVGEDGVMLSGGQRQRIAIARALLKDAPILILDEATAALDNQAEKEVQKALDNLTSGRTVIFIAHRLSTIRNVETIFVMSNGEITESGNHEQLMALKGHYHKLYQMQFKSAE